ncbi:MAG: UDP-N-acetylmuramoyl-tripeptide--D-alanyl-D-alanine ligase [Actinomycetaceae bacterium]|nr:UDP-N-acetylmuramoyl-tripeptide--D-alanyl-D-alanine ligase [Actinomycetaceae bacterium]
MIPVTLGELAASCEGRMATADSEITVDTLVTDTRAITGGEVFAAIQGERINGATLAGRALAAGAAAVITSNQEVALASGADPQRVIEVDDVPTAIGMLARANLQRLRREGHPDLKVVAVTGSVGKTTTKDLLAATLADRGPIIAPPGSFNNELGLPLTVLRADASTATLVLEMGADHIGNIDYLTSIAPPDAAAVLVVARAHLGEFGGIENVARAKAELVTGTRPGGNIVLNADDERVAAMATLADGPVTTFSVTGRGDVTASDIRIDAAGRASFTLVTPWGIAPISLRLVGEHQVANALAAAALSLVIGVPLAQVARVLSGVGAASPHRMDVLETNGLLLIDDSYNANPDSMRAGLAGLARLGEGRRKIAVLGTMLELGESSAAEHEALGAVARECGVEILVCVGNGTKALSSAATRKGITVYDVEDTDAALAVLRSLLSEGDAVLLKGSHGSGVWKVADVLREEHS